MFVEKSRRVLAVLENNLQQFKRTAADGPALKVMTAAVTVALRRLARAGTRFDLVFADPPYGTGDGSRELLANDDLPRVLAPTGRLVLETARRDEMTPPAPWVTERGRVYGDTRITMFRATVRTSS